MEASSAIMAPIPTKNNGEKHYPPNPAGELELGDLLLSDNPNPRLKPPDHSSLVPDGGLIAWIQCAGSFFLFFNGFGMVNTFGRLWMVMCR